MIEIKAGELRGIYEVLNSLRSQLLPANQAYRIARIGRELDNEVNLYEAQRAEIIKKYCDKDENGNPIVDENGNITIKQENENFKKVVKELTKIANEHISINVEPLNLKELSEVKLTPEQMNIIIALIKD